MALPDSVAFALACQPETLSVEIDGIRIGYLAWNRHDSAKPALLLAHGSRGHAHWWSPVASHFTDRFRVYALHFSGMGDSGWRRRYEYGGFVRDLLGVLEATGREPGYLVGHSFGGSIVLGAAAAAPERIVRACVVDSFVPFADTDPESAFAKVRRGGAYPSHAAIRARFRLTPEQPTTHPELLEHVFEHSIRHEGDRWRWKFDPGLPFAPGLIDGNAVLPGIRVPIDYVYGELSTVVDGTRAARIAAALDDGKRAAVVIPGAYHHVMLDQPLALVAVLRGLLLT